MTPSKIQTAIQSLPEALQEILLTLPSGYTANDFDAGEQASLEGAFGTEWASILGIQS